MVHDRLVISLSVRCNISLTLFFSDKPVCLANAVAIVGAAINEPTKVTCEVDGFPPPKNFQWTLNNSMGTSEIEPVSTRKFIMEVNVLVHCTLNRIIDVSVLEFV